jgi:peroxiredoxin
MPRQLLRRSLPFVARLLLLFLGMVALSPLFSSRSAAQAAKVPLTAAEQAIAQQLRGLRGVPDDQRGQHTTDIALQIRALPAGMNKVRLALGLAGLSTEGDFGHEALQAVATTLSGALKETPVPGKDGEPARPYVELASLVKYEHVTTDLNDPQLAQADALLEKQQADVQKADFTLTDLTGKAWTLSSLKGKVVLVNFWATWCPPCRKEMPDLETLSHRFASQGLVVLAISDEDAGKVSPFLAEHKFTYPVLLDPGSKVHESFHVDGIPKTFIFDRDGRLAAQSIDMRTQRQFLSMLAEAGLRE